MNKYVLAGVGNIQFIDKSSGEIVITSKTLTSSGMNFTISSEDVRGGLANQLLAKYFHDSALTLSLEDALFNLEYLAVNVGSTITVGSDVMTTEQVTTTVANQITVTNTPQKFSTLNEIGWYSIAGQDDWTKITFEGKVATVPNLPVGTTVCVKYMKNDATAEEFVVSSAFIPSQCYALLTLPLFKSGTDAQSYSSSSKVGEVQVEIPTFLFDGSQELSLTSSGVATSSLSGSALATFTGNEGCDADGYYAKLKQIIFNKDEFEDVKAIVIADSSLDLTVGETQTLEVYAIYGGNVAPKLLDNAKLTFTSSADAVATVDTTGLVTAVGAGSATISVVVTTKTALEAKAVATIVTA